MKGPSWDCDDEDVRGRTGSSRVAMEVILSTLRSWTVVELVYFTPQAIEPLGGWASKPVQNTRYVGTEHQSFRGLKPEIPSSVYREQWQITESDSATDAHFEKLVLVEAVVSYADERFTMKDLGHSVDVPGFRRHVQRAHDEALLSAVGNTLIDRRMKCVYGTGDLRFAFYLHFYDPARPLESPYGLVECPTIQPVPVRLKILVPYRACT